MSHLSPHRESQALEDLAAGGLYIALHVNNEGQQPTGANELTAEDYERVYVPEDGWTLTGQSPTVLTNASSVSFGVTESDWGSVQFGSLWDAQEGGTAETSTVRLDGAGDVPEESRVLLPAGEIRIALD